MAGRAWTRQWVVALFLLPAALVSGGEVRSAPQDKEPGRKFNSKLPFSVTVLIEEGESLENVGRTPSEEPLEIPACRRWWVEPLGPPVYPPPDMAAVAKELGAQGIPGLKLPPSATDDALVHLGKLKGFKGFRTLLLSGARVTDAGLVHLKELKGLRILDLGGTKVTDAGLVYLRELKGLESLYLDGGEVTDAGLAHLKELKGLQKLDIGMCWRVTDAGLAHLKELKGLRRLSLSTAKVTDAGLAHLKELKGLRELSLFSTKVTDAGIADLKKSLPNVKVER